MNYDLFYLLVLQTWQVTVLVAVVWIAVRLFASDRPHLAHALWALVLIKCITPPLWSSPASPFSWMGAGITTESRSYDIVGDARLRSTQSVAPSTRKNAKPHFDGSDYEEVTTVAGAARLRSTRTDELNSGDSAAPKFAGRGYWSWATVKHSWLHQHWPTLVGYGWLIGAGIGLLVTVFRFSRFLWWLRLCETSGELDLTPTLQQLSKKLGIKRHVRVVVLENPIGPAVLGVLRPTILLPAAIARNKTASEIEPLLAHELIHVRRGDLWWAMLQTIATNLFWFHPLVWLASRMVTRESERSCDEETIACLGCRPAVYARGLLEVLEQKHRLRVAPALPGVRAVDITSTRLERVMKLGNGIHNRTPVWVWLVMLVCGASVLPGAALIWADEKSSIDGSQDDLQENGKPELLAIKDVTRPEQPGTYHEHRFEVGDLLNTIRELATEGESAEAILISRSSMYDVDTKTFVPPREARIVGSQLIANETSVKVKQVEEALDGVREFGFDQIVVETRFVRINQDRINAWGVEWKQVETDASVKTIPSFVYTQSDKKPEFDFPSLNLSTREGIHAASYIDRGTPVLFSVVSELELHRIVAKTKGGEGTSITQAPTVTMFNGRDGEIADVVQRPFITGLKDMRSADGKAVAKQPVISIFETGTRMRVKPLLKPDTIELDCHVQLREVTDVKEIQLSYDPATLSGTRIQVPTVVSTHIEMKQNIPVGDTLLLEMLSDEAGSKTDTLVMVLTCRKISPAWSKVAEAEKNETMNFKSP